MPLNHVKASSSCTANIIKQAFIGNYKSRCAKEVLLDDNQETTVQRVSRQLQLIAQRGRIVFVPTFVNYLGRMEGQSGGGGSPPRN
jgi:hypothetical protein